MTDSAAPPIPLPPFAEGGAFLNRLILATEESLRACSIPSLLRETEYIHALRHGVSPYRAGTFPAQLARTAASARAQNILRRAVLDVMAGNRDNAVRHMGGAFHVYNGPSSAFWDYESIPAMIGQDIHMLENAPRGRGSMNDHLFRAEAGALTALTTYLASPPPRAPDSTAILRHLDQAAGDYAQAAAIDTLLKERDKAAEQARGA